MLYTGIDLHKSFVYLMTVDEKGQTIKQQKIYNVPHEILNYFRCLSDAHQAVVESTIGWYWLTDLLQDHGIDIILANPGNLKEFAKSKIKTDKIDSEILAQLLRTDFIPKAFQMPGKTREKRDLMRSRLNLIQKRTSVINHIHGLFHKYNVTDPNELPDLSRFEFEQLHDHVTFMNHQIKELEKTLSELIILDEDVQRLLWIPGIGKISAFTIYLEVHDFARFPTEKQFFSYARVVPAASNSGGKVKYNQKESKNGNKYLKIVFNDAAVNAYRNYPVIRDFYNRKCRRKNKHIARSIVSKEIARIVYHLSTKKCDYDFTFKGIPLTRRKLRCWPCPTSPGTSVVA